MFDFANPYLLYLLWLVPVFYGLFWWSRLSRRRRLAKFGHAGVLAHLMPDASRYKPAIKIVLRLIALAAVVMVLARPRAGEKQHDKSVAGIEVMIAFDVSNSMLASATDDPNGTSRLDRARLTLEKLVDRLDNNKVGLIIFAGDAKTQLPMTTDFYSAKMYLKELSPALIQNQGTSVAEAIRMAMNGFGPDENVHKAIVLITDSEDHEGDAIDAARLAAENGIQVDVVGLGSAKGAPIPVPGSKGEYFRDNQGQIVTTTLNEKLASEVAEAGGGIYVNGASGDALDKLADRLETLQKSEFKHVSYTAGAEQFPVFAWIALIFLIIDVFVLDRKNSWLKKYNFFSKS
ncbi:MAG: VWA domain-containing protein [Bacteroidales bacterium]|nr:VWA domain-containing protein [Bacteroidales bacterium]